MNGIEKLKADLQWRGPNDKPAAHVVLTRKQAEDVLAAIERLQVENDRLRSTLNQALQERDEWREAFEDEARNRA